MATDRLVAIYPSGATSPSGYAATYTSMSAMESTENGNLTSGGGTRLIVEITASDGNWSTPDSTAVTFAGWTTSYSTGCYILIRTKSGDSARPDNPAFYDSGAYILTSSSDVFTLNNSTNIDIEVEYLQIICSGSNDAFYGYGAANHVRFRQCWLKVTGSGGRTVAHNFDANPGDALVFTNCIIDVGGGDNGEFAYDSGVYYVNCNFVNQVGARAAIETNGYYVYAYGCLLFYNEDDVQEANLTLLRCGTDEGAGEGTNGVDLTPGSRDSNLHDIMTDPDNGDYRLTGSTAVADVIGEGVSQSESSYVPSIDIVGNPRPTGSNRPCIGAFEYIASGTNVNCTCVGLTLTPYQVTINEETSFQTTSVSLTLTAYQADIDLDVNVSAQSVLFNITGYQSGINAKTKVTTNCAELTLTSYQTNVNAAIKVSSTCQELNLTSYQTGINAETQFVAGYNSFILTPYKSTVVIGGATVVDCGVVNLTITSYAADINAKIDVDATYVGLILTTEAVNINEEINVEVSCADLSLSAYQTIIVLDVNIDADVISLSLSTYDALVDTGAIPSYIKRNRGSFLGPIYGKT